MYFNIFHPVVVPAKTNKQTIKLFGETKRKEKKLNSTKRTRTRRMKNKKVHKGVCCVEVVIDVDCNDQ